MRYFAVLRTMYTGWMWNRRSWRTTKHNAGWLIIHSPEKTENNKTLARLGSSQTVNRTGYHDKDEFLYFFLVCEAIGTAAIPGLLCQPRMIVNKIVEKQMECRLAGETEVLGENLPQRHFCPSQNHTWPHPGFNPGRRGGKPATNRLSYGAAKNKPCFLPY
jgi:hypothetical protein